MPTLGRPGLVMALALLMATAAWLALPQATRAATFYNVRGHVTDSINGGNLAGVCVIVRPPDECRATDFKTDVTGTWGPVPLVSGSAWDIYYVLDGYVMGHDVVPALHSTDAFFETQLTRVGAPPPPPPCDTPGTPTMSVFMPNVTKTLGGPNGWNTPFIVQNVGTANTTLEVSFYKVADGGLVRCRKISGLRPGTSFADVPNNDLWLPDNLQFSVVVRSFGAPVVSVVNQIQGVQATFESLAYDAASVGAPKVYLPNVTRRFYGYDVPFIVQNLGAQPTTATASFISFDGTKTFSTSLVIQPGRSGVIDPDFTPGLADGTQYAVTVAADQPITVVVNAHNETNGPPVAYSHNGLSSGARTLFAPYFAKHAGAGDRVSPVVVQNVSAVAVDATLTFSPLDANGTQQTLVLGAIQPGASRAFDPRFSLGTTTPCTQASTSCLGNGEYALKITATGDVAAVVLPVTATTAGAYSAAQTVTGHQYLPNVTRTLGGSVGYTTPIYLQSVGATSATLRWYRFTDGSLAATQTVDLPFNSSTQVDPRSVAGLADDAQYAVIVDAATGSLNAIVYELSYGGGDSVMIYEGYAQ